MLDTPCTRMPVIKKALRTTGMGRLRHALERQVLAIYGVTHMWCNAMMMDDHWWIRTWLHGDAERAGAGLAITADHVVDDGWRLSSETGRRCEHGGAICLHHHGACKNVGHGVTDLDR